LYVTNERGEPEIWLANRKEGRQRPLVGRRHPLRPGEYPGLSRRQRQAGLTAPGRDAENASKRFPVLSGTAGQVASGNGTGALTHRREAWVESSGAAGLVRFRWTLLGDGSLRLDYEFKEDGDFTYCGVSFDFPEGQIRSFRWLGDGPYRVWKNRLRGASLGLHEVKWHDTQPGENWDYPESQGYFAGLRWARFDTAAGAFPVSSSDPAIYLRVGTPRFSLLNTSPEFPAGDISFLHAIPAIGSKFVTAERTGPLSLPTRISGTKTGSLVFTFGL
jgi:hypothetical protein